MQIKIRRAEEKDNAELRALMRDITMPGWVAMSYLREPDFFGSLASQGNDGTVILAENSSGEIIASGLRCKKKLYINGIPEDVGYLSGLRSKAEGISAKTVFRGYEKLKEIHKEKSDVPFYLTTIIEGNDRAEKVLTSGIAPLPVYEYAGKYESVAIPLNRFRKKPINRNIRRLKQEELPQLIDFLNREGRKKQFFPVISEDYLQKLKGVNGESFFANFADGRITGVAAIWDQSSFKQYLVQGYRKDIAIIRPLLNLILKICGFRTLPPTGKELKELCIAFPCTENNNPEILKDIISVMLYESEFSYTNKKQDNTKDNSESGNNYHFLCAAFHEKDPLLDALRTFRHFTYRSSLYFAYWDDGRNAVNKLDKTLIPYLELGAL